MLELFNDILTNRDDPPETWKHTRLIVIFKKGEPKLVSNYRPIALLPILYKLFSRMLCARIESTIINGQSCDQAAYRKGYSTEDHLLSLTLLIEGCNEWNADLFIGMVDFEKAFDSIEHDPMWNVLEEQGVSTEYIALLQQAYHKQTAHVDTTTQSREFSITRGVKQGDPISGLLFICVVQSCMKRMHETWVTNNTRDGSRTGIELPGGAVMTNLRFADDIILLATNRAGIKSMLSDLKN